MNIVKMLLVSLLATLIGLTQTAQAAQQNRITIQDRAQRSIDIPSGPTRIICLGPGCLRLICYLGARDKVVGIEGFEKQHTTGRSYRYAHPELLTLPVIGPGGPANINKAAFEAVLRVKPELIFVLYMDASKADTLQRKLGIPVVILSYGRQGTFDEEVYESLRLAGTILDKKKRADEIVAFIESARKDLQKRVQGIADNKKPKVYAGGIGYRGPQGIESTEPDYAPIDWIHGRNLARQVTKREHTFIDRETLLSWDPDVIFLDGNGLESVTADYEKRPEFYRGLKAVAEKRVYLLWPFNTYTTNLDTVIADAYAVGKILYPDRFSDVDITKKAAEVYGFFVGTSVYEQMKADYGDLGAPWKTGR